MEQLHTSIIVLNRGTKRIYKFLTRFRGGITWRGTSTHLKFPIRSRRILIYPFLMTEVLTPQICDHDILP